MRDSDIDPGTVDSFDLLAPGTCVYYMCACIYLLLYVYISMYVLHIMQLATNHHTYISVGIGEIVGGSQREDRLLVLEGKLTRQGLDPAGYKWYSDLRR